jgi:hypothetical protein
MLFRISSWAMKRAYAKAPTIIVILCRTNDDSSLKGMGCKMDWAFVDIHGKI